MLLYKKITRIFEKRSYCFSKSKQLAIKKRGIPPNVSVNSRKSIFYIVLRDISPIWACCDRPPKIPHYDNYCR